MLIVRAAAFVATTILVFAGYTAVHYRGEYRSLEASVRAENRLRDATSRKMTALFQPAPSGRSSQDLGAPFNVTIVCSISGSTVRNGARVPLDLNAAPGVGDVYRKTCYGVAPSGRGPSS